MNTTISPRTVRRFTTLCLAALACMDCGGQTQQDSGEASGSVGTERGGASGVVGTERGGASGAVGTERGGAESGQTSSDPSGGHASLGGAGESTAEPSVGGTSSSAPTSESGGTSAGSECFQPRRYTCISSCYTTSRRVIDEVCVRGAWRCPEGSVDRRHCPARTCATSPVFCCDPTTGDLGMAACGSDGYWQACASDLFESCSPASPQMESCMELDRLPCTKADQSCRDSAGSCQCQETGDEPPALAWQCSMDLI